MGPQSQNTVSGLLYPVLTDPAELHLVPVGLPLTCPVGPGHESQTQIRHLPQIVGQSQRGLFHTEQGFRTDLHFPVFDWCRYVNPRLWPAHFSQGVAVVH